MQVGPFELRDLIICIVLTLVTAGVMYLFKGILGFGLVLPIWIMVIVLMAVVSILFLLIITITRYLRFGKEGFLFATARRKGIPVYIDMELGSENIDFVLGEKASPKDVVFKDEESGIKVDPSMLDANARPMRASGGLDLYLCSFYNFMPQSGRNTAAFAEIYDYFVTQCRELNFLSIKEFVELISDPEHYLDRNASIKLNKYFKVSPAMNDRGEPEYMRDPQGNARTDGEGNMIPRYTYVRQFQTTVDVKDAVTGEVLGQQVKWIEQDLDLPKMIQLITRARRDVSVLPLQPRYLAGNEAFKYNSVSYSSQHLGHVLMLYYTKMMDDLKSKIDTWMYVIAIVAIIIAGAVAYVIIAQVGK